MSKPLPSDHPLVQAVAAQLGVAMRMDNNLTETVRLGPAVMEILGELVGAAHTPERLNNEVQAIYTMLETEPDEKVRKLQETITRLTGIIDRGRDVLRA